MRKIFQFRDKNCQNWLHLKNTVYRNSLVVQRLRICLPLQGTLVKTLVQEDSTCRGASKPTHHDCWTCALGPRATTTEPMCRHYQSPCALEPMLGNERSHCKRSLHIATSKQPLLTVTTEKPSKQQRPSRHSQKYINTKVFKNVAYKRYTINMRTQEGWCTKVRKDISWRHWPKKAFVENIKDFKIEHLMMIDSWV